MQTAMAGGSSGGKSWDPFANVRATVQLTRQQLETFYNDNARAFGKVLGQDIPAAANVATGDLARFYEQMLGVNVEVPKANNHMKALADIAKLEALRQGSEALKKFGEEVLKFLGQGVQGAMDFEVTAINLRNALEINADPAANSVGGLTARLAELQDVATKVALDTKFNDAQILDSISLLAENGITSENIIKGAARSAAVMAQATKTELIPATEVLTGVMHGFSKTLGEQFGGDMEKGLGRVADIMTNIKLTTGASLTDIGNSMKYAAPIADEFGLKFDEIATAVDVLYRAGIRGSQTGTAMRRLFTSITAPTDKAAEAMDQLARRVGLTGNMFVTAEGNVKPMIEIQRLLHDSLDGLSDAQKAQYVHTIFGQYAMQSMMKIAGTSVPEFERLAGMVTKSGSAAKLAGEWAESAEGRWQNFTENIGVAKRQLGTELLEAIKDIIKPLNNFVTAFTNLDPSVKKVIAVVLAVVGGLATLVGTIGTVVASIGLMNAGLALAGTSLGAIAAAAAPVIAVIAAVAAVGAALYAAYQTNFLGFRDLVNSVWTEVSSKIGAAVGEIKTWWDSMQPSLQAAWTNIEPVVMAIVAAFRDTLMPILSSVFRTIGDVIAAFWNTAVALFRAGWQVISGVVEFIVKLLAGDWVGAFEGAKKAAVGAFTFVYEFIAGFVRLVGSILGNLLRMLVESFGFNFDAIKAKTSEVFSAIGAAITGAMKTIALVVATTWALMHGDWDGALEGIAALTGTKKETIVAKVRDIINSVKSFFTNLPSEMYQFAVNAVQSFINGIEAMIDRVASAASKITSKIADFVGFHSPSREGEGRELMVWGPNFVKGLVEGIESARPLLQQTMSSIGSDLSLGVNANVSSSPSYGQAFGGVGGRGPTTYQITLNFNGNTSRQDADYVVNQLRRVLPMP
jgi:TP901 family phage tail tape measure protein